MAKRKHSESHATEAPDQSPAAGNSIEHAAGDLSAERLGELADEVRAFIDRRDELASKLSQEIELTEKKLAELKRTAALLFPENAVNGHGESGRPEKKLRKVSLGKTAKSPRESAADESQTSQPAVQTEPQASEAPSGDGSGLGGVNTHGNPS